MTTPKITVNYAETPRPIESVTITMSYADALLVTALLGCVCGRLGDGVYDALCDTPGLTQDEAEAMYEYDTDLAITIDKRKD